MLVDLVERFINLAASYMGQVNAMADGRLALDALLGLQLDVEGVVAGPGDRNLFHCSIQSVSGLTNARPRPFRRGPADHENRA